jgi:hypothetical protein
MVSFLITMFILMTIPRISAAVGCAVATFDFMNHGVHRGRVGCVAGVFLWGGVDNLIQEKDEKFR